MSARDKKFTINMKFEEYEKLKKIAETKNIPAAIFARNLVLKGISEEKYHGQDGDNFTYAGKAVSYDPESEIEELKKRVLELEDKVDYETVTPNTKFTKKHFRTAFNLMHNNGIIDVFRLNGKTVRKGTFPEDTIIRLRG